MNITRFIKGSDNPYQEALDIRLKRVAELVENNIISPRLGAALVDYLIRMDVSELIKKNVRQIIGKSDNERWLFVNYGCRTTTYQYGSKTA
ncbi:hypothetical protein A2160_03155 [Candidatus Beckwithbacteria bacterium RBG_13_42_9]|uniref:Uncharacterized protein n=1 Tax=Candidatus Beckwithbacteria bacterium RBG_13_42_9 TaxID=1797457 RepID=A0A1F5E7U2_9BACT|nr:MAG: hypothetical protein A2160_03155 [Candidatus Beckwithbacteria bacterium RBG_13_42_9]